MRHRPRRAGARDWPALASIARWSPESTHRQASLAARFDRLPQWMREVLVMHFRDKFEPKEIAHRLGLSQIETKRRLDLATKAMLVAAGAPR